MTHLSRVGLYRDADGQWRFRAVALNGEIVAVSEAYRNRTDAEDEARLLWPDVEIEYEED